MIRELGRFGNAVGNMATRVTVDAALVVSTDCAARQQLDALFVSSRQSASLLD